MLIAARLSGSGSGKDLLSRTADETEVRRQIEEIERRHGGNWRDTHGGLLACPLEDP
jgi:hypothetical protein